jgi:serine/threonine-protein kinase
VLEIDAELLAGGVSFGSYRLVERLSQGGMGEVWVGKHVLLARPAAIKLIRPEITQGDEATRRFEREAQVTATLRSPHTVELYDFGIGENGAFYYVMELLEGMDLRRLVDQFGPLPPERVVALLQQACLSLSEAHEQGLVHRDIKPGNLFITRLGPEYDYLKVLDFGMVKGPMGDSGQISIQGMALGTPAFMAPELALELQVDGRADLYSLGCTAYFLLTGKILFDAPTPTGLLLHHVQTPAKPPSAVAPQAIPPALDAAVLHCLEKSPETRPASALALWEELGRVVLAAPWTQARARDWWQRHGPERPTPVTDSRTSP